MSKWMIPNSQIELIFKHPITKIMLLLVKRNRKESIYKDLGSDNKYWKRWKSIEKAVTVYLM